MNLSSVQRDEAFSLILKRLRTNPVVILLGPRQCGKTTLARQIAEAIRQGNLAPDGTPFPADWTPVTVFDLENPADQQRLSQPMTALEPLRGLVVIDEAQLSPALFPVLRVLADRRPLPAHFLLLGSASPELIRGSSESLAGRVAHIPMSGFGLGEVGAENLRQLWWRGGFPRSFLATDDAESRQWRDDFILSFVERDLHLFGVQVSSGVMRRFWNMTAHYHGQIWNSSELGRSLGHTHSTIKHHLDILCEAFVLRQLPPWFENIGKRQIKAPKVYFRDSGLLHSLLGAASFGALESHPKLGASWEGFALEEVLRVTGDREAYFWGTQGLAELDLLVFWNGRRLGFEFKYADAPVLTKSMRAAHRDLGLERLFVVYPGSTAFPLAEAWAEALPVTMLAARLREEC